VVVVNIILAWGIILKVQKKKVMMAKYAPSRIVKASEADAVAVD
jgi:hypothetical protein